MIAVIIVRLIGGLGNQMIQYAVGRRLAYNAIRPLKLDIGWYDDIPTGNTVREYGLHVFNIEAELASPEEVANAHRIRNHRCFPYVMQYMPNITWSPGWTYVLQSGYQFEPRMMKLSGETIYLDGYWFSEKYFKDIRAILKKDFTARTRPDGMNAHLSQIISDSQSVAVHVRRGDYASHMRTNLFHGTCLPSYYQRAIELIARKVPSASFFIFSDDPLWTKKNIRTEHRATYIDHNPPGRAYEDLRLMLLCKHHIIANSTLSWWGAWLSDYADKIVIAPQRWFADPQINTKDILPEDWVRL